MGKHWYVVHTYSGYEQKAKKALEERIKQHNVEHLFEEVLVPQENVVEVKKGVKRTTKRQFFPGYILVRMDLNETTWHIVKGTPKVTGFVGGSMNPRGGDAQAQDEGGVREGREREGGQRPILHLHRHRGRGPRGQGQAQGHGEHIRAFDADRVGFHAG